MPCVRAQSNKSDLSFAIYLAHEMYQRTHKSSTRLADGEEDGDDGGSNKIGSLKVAGRMSRKAARLGCIADALFTAELCELIHLESHENDDVDGKKEEEVSVHNDKEGTLAAWTERKVVLKTTISTDSESYSGLSPIIISVMVIYEPGYSGGAGIGHGGVDDLLRFSEDDLIKEKTHSSDNAAEDEEKNDPRGRYIVILSDNTLSNTATVDDLPSAVSILDKPPSQLRLQGASDSHEKASVCEPLYRLAGSVVDAIESLISEASTIIESDPESESHIRRQCEPAIHIVGHSLSGGVAALTALILDGTLPSPMVGRKSKKIMNEDEAEKKSRNVSTIARGRASAFCLGPPPCISQNLQTPFITSIIHGDDIICRASHATLKHLYERTRHSVKGGILGRSVGWMTDAVSLTVSGLKSQSKKATGDDRLVVPGKVFLIRPRKIGGGSSSIHEVGDGAAGVRESIRAAVLWQLNDILLSGSMLKHHGLDSYIRSLDRVKLSGLADESSSE